MAIRLRVIDGTPIAICAARSVPKEGDIYLDDCFHHALYVKFHQDFKEEGKLHGDYPEPELLELMESEESNNPNREWWNSVYETAR